MAAKNISEGFKFEKNRRNEKLFHRRNKPKLIDQ